MTVLSDGRGGATAATVVSTLSLLLGGTIVASPSIADLNITDLVLCSGKGGGGESAPTIIWSPSVVVTKRNTTLAVAQAQWRDGRNVVKDGGIMSRSVDGGRTFGPNQNLGMGGANLLASTMTDTVHAFGLIPKGCPPVLSAAVAASTPTQCAEALTKYCPSVKAQKDTCLACLKTHQDKFFDGACSHSELSDYCDKTAPPCPRCGHWPTPPPPPPPGCPSGNALTMASSTDDGVTWSDVKVLVDPFVVGEGELNHGIELQRGPHRGRWVLPYCKNPTPGQDRYAGHALAAYSDNGGRNWTQGALTPAYSGEAAITELGNGSLLISFRSEGEHMPSHPHNRGFARSDDGGATWAQVWYANDPNRTTGMIDGPSDQGIDRSDKTGAVYFGHPGSCCDRANYTIHRSTDEGATFEFVGVIFPGGAGYSDVHVLPYDGPGDRLGVAFQRALNESGVEGGGYNMAWASMAILP